HLELRAAVLAEARGVDLHHIILERLDELLALRLACCPPIPAEHELGNAWRIEILLGDRAETLLELCFGKAAVARQREHGVTGLGDEISGAFCGKYRRRLQQQTGDAGDQEKASNAHRSNLSAGDRPADGSGAGRACDQ